MARTQMSRGLTIIEKKIYEEFSTTQTFFLEKKGNAKLINICENSILDNGKISKRWKQ